MIGLRVTKHNRMKHREKQVLNRPASVYPDRIHARRSSYRRSISNLRHIPDRQKAPFYGLFWHLALKIIIKIALSQAKVFSENAETDCNFTPGVKKSGMPKRVG